MPSLSYMTRGRSGEDGQSTWFFFLLLSCSINLALAIILGNMNFRPAQKKMLWHILARVLVRANMVPFMDVNNMNEYDMVSPDSKGARLKGECSVQSVCSVGNQLMDAGRVHFIPESKLDIGHSMGFRNMDTYCVAPITIGEQENYDFWAVGLGPGSLSMLGVPFQGLNCCSGHVADFHCGWSLEGS